MKHNSVSTLTAACVALVAVLAGCAQPVLAPTPAAPAAMPATPATATVPALKMGKEEGAIDKAFFNQVVAAKAGNVTLVDVRTKFEFVAGNFAGSRHIPINDVYSEGCPSTIARLPKEGFVVFVCATGARAGEMYFGLKDDCKMDMKRFAYLDAEVMYGPKGAVVK